MHSVFRCRGSLFLLTYLLFPVNVLIGVLLAVWRMIITALFNIVHMGRMDISLLNRNVEAFDPGEPITCTLCEFFTNDFQKRLDEGCFSSSTNVALI